MKHLEDKIFEICNEMQFNEIAMEVFHYQAFNNEIYSLFLQLMNIDKNKISNINEIPFLPIQFFKQHKIVSGKKNVEAVFESSGTTGSIPSKHYVASLEMYEKSFLNTFRFFFGNETEYCFLALLPSYLERGSSSLIYMMKVLIDKGIKPFSNFYLSDLDGLIETLKILKQKKQKTILIGVTFALLELAETKEIPCFEELIVMETGGMKGRREELTREELHKILTESFQLPVIHSEYGMTELLSQGYSKGEGVFQTPPWLKILVRDPYDPRTILEKGKNGAINIIDLANLYSCSFIETLDLGKISEKGFHITGRFDNSDIRGCNLLVL